MSGVEDLNVPVGVIPSSCLETTVIVPRKDMIFPSLEALKEAYITFADSQGFGVKILNSHYDDEKILKRVTFACSKAGYAPKKTPSTKPVSVFHRKTSRTNCQARLQATMLETGEYGVLNVFLEHNHDLLDPEMARCLRKKREVSLSKKRRIALNDKTRLGAPKTVSSSKTMSSYAIEADNNLVPYSQQNVRLSLMSSTSTPMADSSKGTGQSVDPEMEDEYTHQSKLLQELVSMSTINKAWIFGSNSGNDSQGIFSVSQPNLFSNAKKTLILSSHISKNANHPVSFHWSPFPIEMSGVSTIVPSPSGSKLLVVRNKDDDSPTLLEIWSQSKLEKELRIPQSVHDPFFTDGWFEGISWNQDENQIAYVAEEPSRPRPTFDDLGFKKEGNSEKDNGCWKGQGDWEEDWGETYSRKRNPALFVINTENGEVRAVKGVARSLSVGQVIWAPVATANSPSYLVFVGWTQEQKTAIRKLGMKYCYNRPCSLYAVQSPFDDSKLDATETNDTTEGSLAAVKLIPKISSAFSPLFSPDGKSLLFLSAKSSVDSGVHSATNSLHRIDWPVGEIPGSPTNVYDVVPVVMCAEDGCFPGLYCSNMLPNPWLSDGRRIVLSSYWHSVQVILAIDAFSGKISRVTPADSNYSWDVLSLDGDNILAVSSSPVDPPQIKYGCYEHNKKQSISWNWIDVPSSLPGCSEKVKCILSSLKFDVLKIPVSDSPENLTEGSKKPIEAIYISSSSNQSEGDKNTPLIVMLHGGPHSVSLTSYSKNLAFLAALGYKLLSVNYRGSLGFGEEALQSLPGKIGSQDVNDVLVAMDHAIKMGLADSSKIAVLGGSHGGFLTTHLIGQVPDRFAVAAVRNPVCNLSLMVGTSDIPDWCFVSAYGSNGMNYYTEAPTMDHLRHLFNRSPIYHLPKVRAPILFLLGAQDLRVPFSNGLQYARALKEKGNEVKVVVFPNDVHTIERPQSDFESFLNIGVWFKKYCR